jgi:uncharacterized protein YuzE
VRRTLRMVVAAPRGGNASMKIKYFKDTDTLYIELRRDAVVETKDLDQNTQIDLDRAGNICAITIEHAKERADLPHFSFEEVGA